MASTTITKWLLAFSVLLSGCSHLLYHPTYVLHVDPKKLDLHPETVWSRTEDNLLIHGWYFKAKSKPRALLVFFHGNGQNISSHFVSLAWILDHGYDFFIFDYRGYAYSQGKPSPEGTVLDGKAVLRTMYERNPKLPIVVFGQSLGGAVAMRTVIEVKNQIPIRGVIVESTFQSYQGAARRILSNHWFTWPFQPMACVTLSDEWAPEDRIHEISPIPMMVIHGDSDPMIDIELGREVYEKAGEPKVFHEIEGARHTEALWVNKGEFRKVFLKWLDGLKL